MFGWKTKARSALMDMAERSAALNGANQFAGHGLIAGTRVASNLGWRCVEALTPGDKVLTFDHGMQTVIEVRRTSLWSDATSIPRHMLPLHVPEHALGNRIAMRILPEQGVLVESDAATDAHGDPFAVITASALDGFRRIEPDGRALNLEIVTLFFAQPQVIYAEGGLLIYCPQTHLALSDMIDPNAQPYEVLSGEDAAYLVECMKYEDLSTEYRPAAQHGSAYAA